ncbi:MAG: hypothetical protein IV097_09615 [Burkholderiaceae bacterium]|nr:hypothetical protein [Burkholderiaceae bacterium]
MVSNKYLTEKNWSDFSKKLDYDDKAWLKALTALSKAEKAGPEEQLKALDLVQEEADDLLKKNKADKPLAAYLKDVDAAIKDERKSIEKEIEKADKEAQESEGEEEESPTLLTTKMVPLLREVRKGTVLKAMIAVAGKDCVVMVSRKPIGPPRRKLLTTELGTTSGVKFVMGECIFEQNAHTFVLMTQAAGMAKKIKEALLKQTEQRYKIRVRGEDPNDIDDDGEPAESGADQDDDEDEDGPITAEQAQYEEKLETLEPLYLKAMKEQRPDAQRLRGVFEFMAGKATTRDWVAALKSMAMLNTMLGNPVDLAKVAIPPAPPRPPAGAAAKAPAAAAAPVDPNDPGQKFNARLAALLPRIQGAPAEVAADIKLKVSEAGMFARKKEFDSANGVLDAVEKLLGGAAAKPAGDESTAFNARLAALLPKVKDAVTAGRPDAQEIKLKVGEAGGLARNKKFDAANAMLAEVELALAKAPEETSETEAEEPAGDAAEVRYFKLFNQLEADYLAAIKTSGSDNADISDRIAKLKQSWGRASDAAEGEKYADAVLILQKLIDDKVLENLLEAKREAAAESKPSGIVAQRTFMLERWARIPTELSVELQTLRKSLEGAGTDGNPAELTDAIEAHLHKLLADMQNQLDAGINAGNMGVFKGLRQRVETDSVIGHLLKAPFMNGSKFKQAALDAMSEIEEAMTA